jgi:transposase
MGRVEIFQGRARRRWSEDDKRRLVAETFAPGETVHGVARRRGVSTSQLFTWRKRLRVEAGFPPSPSPVPGFVAVTVAPSPVPTTGGPVQASPGLIEVELAGGERVRISGPADPAVVAAALRALAGR